MDQEELRKLEYMCIQECAPWCAAKCPVHVDVRAMNAAVSRGDFQLALGIFRKAVPFPGIISHICDRPCQDVCKHGEVGESIAIRALEKAAMAGAPQSKSKLTLLPKNNKRVAIVGAGLSGLTAAFDLAKKGYGVVVFEGQNKLGGAVWHHAEEVLPRQIIVNDLQLLDDLPLEIRSNAAVGQDVTLPELESVFDAVYLGVGEAVDVGGELAIDDSGRILVHEVTFETSRPGVFAGGTAISGKDKRSPIRSISDGRRAAISIDRYVKKVSLTASRENEGAYETRLFTSVAGRDTLPQVPAANPIQGYSAQEAAEEAKRCLQCECMECVKICDYLEVFKAYPRKYVRQIYNNLSIVMGQRHGNKLINSCSMCGLCKEVCPEDLHMGEVCKGARATMVKQGKMPASAHEFALRDMEFSNSNLFAVARHEPGMQSSAFLFFPGCQLAASAPEHVSKMYAYLRERLDGGVGLMLRCCGAPADWSGRAELFADAFHEFEAEWRRLGSPRLVLACSTCYSVFKNRLPNDRIVSLWELIDTLGVPLRQTATRQGPLAVHDACTTRHDSHIHQSVRNIARKLGHELQELSLSKDMTECCGFGGLMRFANRELSDLVIKRRISETPANLLTYCANCRDHFASHGKPTWHLLDLIFGDVPTQDIARRGPDYSQRRENRFRLKRSLLKELWGEQSVEKERDQRAKLYISDEVREIMEKRMILVEDLQHVIDWAERTGAKLVHRETGHFLAHYRPTTVTYWVEYSPYEDGYAIHNAYSHRMQVMEDVKP